MVNSGYKNNLWNECCFFPECLLAPPHSQAPAGTLPLPCLPTLVHGQVFTSLGWHTEAKDCVASCLWHKICSMSRCLLNYTLPPFGVFILWNDGSGIFGKYPSTAEQLAMPDLCTEVLKYDTFGEAGEIPPPPCSSGISSHHSPDWGGALWVHQGCHWPAKVSEWTATYATIRKMLAQCITVSLTLSQPHHWNLAP